MFDYLADCLCLFWGRGYGNYDIPAQAKALLCGGLREKDLPFAVAEADEETALRIAQDKEFITIGSDGGTDICITARGELFSVDRQGEYPVRFINSNLNALLGLAGYIFKQRDDLLTADDETAGILTSQLRENLTAMDARTFADEENWWSVLFEQLEQDFTE